LGSLLRALVGIAGMFLAIPILAILKIIFDRTENLEAWGYFDGDDVPNIYLENKIKSKEAKKDIADLITVDENDSVSYHQINFN
jgi:hypothetical protein